jgi:hypothetical protein
LKNLKKQDLYDWFTERPIVFPAEYRLLEIFLISNFDEAAGMTVMTKAGIRKATGFSKYLVNRYIDDLEESGTWLAKRNGTTHTYFFSPNYL